MSRPRPTSVCHGRSRAQSVVESSLPSEGSIGALPPSRLLSRRQGKVVHLGDGSTIPLRVRLGILLARGGILLHARRLGSRTIHLPMDDSLLLLLVLLCLATTISFCTCPAYLNFVRPLISPRGGDSPPPSSDA